MIAWWQRSSVLLPVARRIAAVMSDRVESYGAQAHVGAAMPDLELELAAVRDVASLTGFNIMNIRPGPDARGIDVLFDLDGCRVGVQHTIFHSDEGHIPTKRGSPTRAKEEGIARATEAPSACWEV
jgi:hypothetical protein